MHLFLGSHQNRLNTKGRMSIPTSFRSTLRKEEKSKEEISVIFRPSHILPCIECWSLAVFIKFSAILDNVDILSTEHSDLATLIYAQAWPMDLDREERVLLPEIIKQHANLTDKVTFMDLGTIFQIWESNTTQKHYKTIMQRTKIIVLPHTNKVKAEHLEK